MRNRFFPQQSVGIVDQEACGIEHDQHFRQQCFYVGFAGFARD